MALTKVTFPNESTPLSINDWENVVSQLNLRVLSANGDNATFTPFDTVCTYDSTNLTLSVTIKSGTYFNYLGQMYLNDADLTLSVACSSSTVNDFVLLLSGGANVAVVNTTLKLLQDIGNYTCAYDYVNGCMTVTIEQVTYCVYKFGISYNTGNNVFLSTKYTFGLNVGFNAIIEYGNGDIKIPADLTSVGNISSISELNVTGSVNTALDMTVNGDSNSVGVTSITGRCLFSTLRRSFGCVGSSSINEVLASDLGNWISLGTNSMTHIALVEIVLFDYLSTGDSTITVCIVNAVGAYRNIYSRATGGGKVITIPIWLNPSEEVKFKIVCEQASYIKNSCYRNLSYFNV